MRTITSLLLLISVTATMLTSCTKFDEGPGLSLRSAESKLDGDWIVLKATEADGDDATDLFANFTYTFTKDGVFRYRFEQGNFGFDAVGAYSFNKDSNVLSTTATYEFQGLPITDEETVTVLRLTPDELIILTEDGGRIEYQRPA